MCGGQVWSYDHILDMLAADGEDDFVTLDQDQTRLEAMQLSDVKCILRVNSVYLRR